MGDLCSRMEGFMLSNGRIYILEYRFWGIYAEIEWGIYAELWGIYAELWGIYAELWGIYAGLWGIYAQKTHILA